MKKVVFCLVFTSILSITKVWSQSLFQKSYSPFFTVLEQEVLSDDNIIVAGINTVNSISGIPLVRFNNCGEAVWSIRLASPTNNIDLVDMRIDQGGNIILAGNFFIAPGDRNAYIMSITNQGSLNYFKVFDTGTSDISYSMDINDANEILLYFKTDIGKAGPNSSNTLAKFNADGQVRWIKSYGFTGVWGQMCSSSDGGALIVDNLNISKIDASGNVSWNKTFTNSFYCQDPFRVQDDYVLFRYGTSAINGSYATMLDQNGNLKWNSQLLPNFRAKRGIVRANGNLLFLGDLQIQAIQNNPTIIEIDSSNGDIIQTIIHEKNTPLTNPVDLNELSDRTIFYSAYESLSFSGSVLINKVNQNLNRLSCKDTSVNLNYPIQTGSILNANSWSTQTVSIPITEPTLNVDTFPLSQAQILCEYNPLQLDLGKDTIVCRGESIGLESQTIFEGYEWSNGKKTNSIQIENAGSYWLKAWIDCDTISDTIMVDLHPKTHFKSSVSPETAFVLDSVIFRLIQPSKYQSLQWNFGDSEIGTETDSIHAYKTSGWFYPKLTLKDTMGCVYDSSMQIYIQSLPFKIPNVFTPNGDGVNDFFQVVGNGIEEMEISIFNRWGNLVFESKKASWDGRATSGGLCKNDTYFYTIRFKQSGNPSQIIKGQLSLIR